MSSSTTTVRSDDIDADVTDPGMSRGMRRAVTSAAAVIGAGVALAGFAAPASAHPAPSYYPVWNRVASCESGGNWHIDTGNGFYGGVQFSSSTWANYGGHKYADEASGASRREQIEVARRVLKAQGPDAWPVCGPNAGLTKSDGAATSKKLPMSDEQLAVKRADDRRSAGKHRSTAKPVAAQRAVTEAKVSHSKPQHVARHSAERRAGYVVKAGDTLHSIAQALHVHGGWHALFAANRATVHNPNMLRIGQRLVLPKA